MVIQLERDPAPERLQQLGVRTWPTWGADISTFPWTYDSTETCYILAGEVVVTPSQGDPVSIRQGDLVTFPAGLSCTWDIKKPIRKHYRFD